MSAGGAGGALRLAVVGAGWAGLSASVHAVARGHGVTLFETARQPGGRARSLADGRRDNGQHILIGAYHDTLALMRQVGVDPDESLLRLPLALHRADGARLQLQHGAAVPAFMLAVLRCQAWTWAERLHLLSVCGQWAAAGFRCQPDRSVAELCHGLPATVRDLLIDPLCVAALNTPAAEASAAVFLRVLRDGLFSGRGACDLLLPRRPLHDLLPGPALRWLRDRGAEVQQGRRVMRLQQRPAGWMVDDQPFDAVVLACSALEAARLVDAVHPGWSATARALRFEPIVTAEVTCAGARLPAPMIALSESEESPAQFVFDQGAISGRAGTFSFVISGAAPWVARGLDATAQAVLDQARRCLPPAHWPASQAVVDHIVAERRATFRCTPDLRRPARDVAPGLAVAGDYVDGPYPATLEGAVRSGAAAVKALSGLTASTMQNSVSPAPRPP